MTTNRPEFKAHDDFIFEHKEVGRVTREEFIKYIRSSHEHMRKLSQLIQQYNQTIDGYLNEWDGNLESFDDDVKDLLGRWIQDGTMDHIINENLMNIKADKEYVDDLNENVTAQLAQIVRIVPVKHEDVAKSINDFYENLEENTTLKVPSGEYDLYDPLVFNRKINLDFTGVTFNYFGDDTALTVGKSTGTGISSCSYILPNLSRHQLNWADSVNGVKILNINTSVIHFGDVTSFRRGITIEGYNYGNSYNEYHLKRVVNNLESLVLTSNASGWSNENLFISGRFGLTSATASQVTEENTHVLIEDNGYVQNNNVFLGVSFESGANKGVEHVAKIENGRMIYFRDCRYENVYNVDITDGTDIQFTNGFGISNLNFKNNQPHVIESHAVKRSSKLNGFEFSSSASAANDIANYYSGGTSTPRFTIEGNGSLTSRGSIRASYGYQWGTGSIRQSLSSGSGSPIGNVEATAGSVYINNSGGGMYTKTFGNGTAGWGRLQPILTSTSSNRSTPELVGTQVFDTTLKQPIWWTGDNWVDATGSVV